MFLFRIWKKKEKDKEKRKKVKITLKIILEKYQTYDKN